MYATSVVVAAVTVAIAFLSGRLRHGYSFCHRWILVNSAGYAILLAHTHVWVSVRYVALYFTTIGGFSRSLTPVRMNNNFGSHCTKRYPALACILGWASLAVFLRALSPSLIKPASVFRSCLTGLALTISWRGFRKGMESAKEARGITNTASQRLKRTTR